MISVSPICLHVFFFSTWKLCTIFFLDRTSFNIKGMQSFTQFLNCMCEYRTAQGGSLFGVSIFVKFKYRDYRERNELLKVSHLMTRGKFLHLSRKLGFVVLVNIPFFTVERKGEKREKFEGNMVVHVYSVLFSRSQIIKGSCEPTRKCR